MIMDPCDVISSLKSAYRSRDWDGLVSVILALEEHFGSKRPISGECREVLFARAYVEVMRQKKKNPDQILQISQDIGEA